MNFLHHYLHLLIEAGGSFLLGLLIGAAFEVFIPKSWTERWLAKGPGSVVFASLAGALLPGCAVSSVPIARSLRNKGAPLGTVAAFLIIAPLLSPHTLAITGAMLGLGFAAVRLILPLVFTISFGTLVNAFSGKQMPSSTEEEEAMPRMQGGCCHGAATEDTDREESGCCHGNKTTAAAEACCHDKTPGGDDDCCCHKDAHEEEASCCHHGEKTDQTCCCKDSGEASDSCCHGGAKETKTEGTCGCHSKPEHTGSCCGAKNHSSHNNPFWRLALHFWDNTRALAPIFLLSLAVAALVTTFISPAEIAKYGNSWMAWLLACVGGIPLYVCDGGDIPLTRALLDMGLANGPAFTFMLASAGTCLPTMGMAPGIIGRRLTVLYILSTLGMALLGGLLVQAFPLLHAAGRG